MAWISYTWWSSFGPLNQNLKVKFLIVRIKVWSTTIKLFSSKLDEELLAKLTPYHGSLDPSIGLFLGSDIFETQILFDSAVAFMCYDTSKMLNLLYCLVWIFNSYKLDILTL
ncbi:hypothetical protein HYD64_00840 [Mycoplasmopsis bovis]|nr:hypothetical protein [Mycoplasmopsis bovis]QQH60123.1 hypothetical protein HYD64_00840 [Mycoplasmopsis bovis]